MPIYQYRCLECGHEEEVLQKISEPLLTDCGQCHKKNSLEKCVTAPRFRLNGSGYYETDEKPKAKQRYLAKESDTATPAEKPSGCNKGGDCKSHAH
jgi:putative FmdB family regulatory protein